MRPAGKAACTKLTNHLESLIAANVYTPGDKLPTRRELAAQFGLTSYAVQQGFEHLAAKGLVVLKHGSGVYVATRRRNESRTGWKIQVFLCILNFKEGSYLFHALQGLQEEALRHQVTLILRQRNYYGHHLEHASVRSELDPGAQGVIFLGEYDYCRLDLPLPIPCCGLEMEECYGGNLSPITLDPWETARLATEFFQRRKVRHVRVHQLRGGVVFASRGACFQRFWEPFGTSEIREFQTPKSANAPDPLPDDPQIGHFFTSGSWCELKLKEWKARYGSAATERLGILSVDGKSLLAPGYEPVSTIAIDWKNAGRVAFQEILRRLEYPGAEARRTLLIPKLHEIPG